ncbi:MULTISPECIES: hypothetical protein [unclassified Streptomyces]|uniref:hypothetical protein n=1 Tax=unclassified Streptomyces TaxID=2593676 RepID=UPI00166139AA|nr:MULTISPECIES: hypothetical protein [unclassified Streptomyces]MBD0710086.1 hypothetical protein [Streptomyces sp. CBMA291]MBD0715623.1 hypothetical protein [Streptomyces sp. CBMA370]
MDRGISVDNDGTGVVVIGDNNTVGPGAERAVGSAYRTQLLRLAPPELVDRETELAELADFCRTGRGYRWWRADAWAGKSALMSWLALHPPEGVRIVPFFVTARLGAQNDVVAYVDVVLEQLAHLAGEGLPALLTAATREAHLLRLYETAADTCARRGERLVLLVDGLDEDRGLTTGPEAHSIAALLPYSRPDLPVLVSGRLNPPLPADVPEGHPLRDPATVRILAPSPRARVIRYEAERELKSLLTGGGLTYELLALLTAAGGGLTADDLAELTGEIPYQVRDVLRTGPGRTFALRGGAYLLAHEELAVAAREMLGHRELERCRETLRGWAEEWRARDWPAGSPAYLLHGWFPMLRETGDLDGMLTCALDGPRHERLLEETGGIGGALAEIRATGEAVLERGDGEALVATMLRLAFRRSELSWSAREIPAELAACWAAAGQVERAVAMVRREDRVATGRGLCVVGLRLIEWGDRARAEELAVEAEGLFYGESNVHERRNLCDSLVRLLLALGHRDRAERAYERIDALTNFGKVVPHLVAARCAAGEYDRAAALARAEPDSDLSTRMTETVVRALLAAHFPDRAEAVVREAAVARPALRPALLLDASRAWGDAGRVEQGGLFLAEALAELADGVDRAGGDSTVRALAAAGAFDCLDALLATSEREPEYWGDALARGGAWDRARAAAESAPRYMESQIRQTIAREMLNAGLLEEAEKATLEAPYSLLWGALAAAHLRAGELDRVGALRARPDTWWDIEVHAAYAKALCAAGRRAEAMALLVGGPSDSGIGIGIADALLDAGEQAAAVELLTSLERRLRVPRPRPLAWSMLSLAACLLGDGSGAAKAEDLLASVRRHRGLDEDDPLHATVLLARGQRDRAEELAWQEENAWTRERWLVKVLQARLAAGEYTAVARLGARAADELLSAADELLSAAVRGLVEAGAWEEALPLLEEAGGFEEWRLSAVMATGLARAGRVAEAARWLRKPEQVMSRGLIMLVLVDVTRAYLTLGRHEEAVRLVERARVEMRDWDGNTFETAVARALVLLGSYEEAVDYVRETASLDAGSALISVAEQLITEKEYEQALTLLGELNTIGQPRAALYTKLALVHPHPQTARECAARALHLGDWREDLPAVLHCAPETVPLLVAEGERLRGLLARYAERDKSDTRTSSTNASPRT